MDTQLKWMLLLVAAIVLINLTASIAVLRATVFSSSQRVLQFVLIWFVPVIGAGLCLVFRAAEAQESASFGAMVPLRLPADGGSPDGPGLGLCGCAGSDAGGGGGE